MNLLLRPIMPPGQRYPIPQRIWTRQPTPSPEQLDDDEIVPLLVAIHGRKRR